MTLPTNQISITSTATSIIGSSTTRKSIKIRNTGSYTVYVGSSSSVVSSTSNSNGGYPIEQGEILVMNDYTGTIYGICESGQTSTVAYLEEDLG